jgi:Methylamine utilisation protein MauE
MVETITPVVHGGRRGRWGIAVGAHILGAVLGAAALGGALGLAGRALGAPWGAPGLSVVAAVAAVYAGRELLGIPVPLPDRKRQVPEWWRTFFGPISAPFLYGLGLGVGFLTYLRHGTLVAVAALAVISGDPRLAALILVPFGLARGLTVLLAAPGVSAEGVGSVMARLDALALSEVPRWVNGIALVALGSVAAASAPLAAVRGSEGSGLAAELVALVFAWAAIGKALRFRRWRGQILGYGLPAAGTLAVAVPLVEAGVPALVVGGFPTAAGALALGLLAAFSAAILRARRLEGDRLPCGCFGGGDRRDYRLLLARNLALGAVAAAALADPAGDPWADVGPAELLPVVLLAVGLLMTAFLLREVRRLALARTGQAPSS